MIAPPLAGVGMWVRALVIERRERRAASGVLANRDSPSLVERDAAGDRIGLGAGRVLSAFEHPGAVAHGARRALLVPAGDGHRAGDRGGLTWLYHRVRWKGGAVAVALAVAVLRLPVGASTHARTRLHGRPHVLARDAGGRAEQRQGPSELLGDAGRARTSGPASANQQARARPGAELADGAHLLRRHAVPAAPSGRGLARVPPRLRDGGRTIQT